MTIDYATGDNYADGTQSAESTDTSASTTTSNEAPVVVEATPEPAAQEPASQGTTYILNTNTRKFHYPTCGSVGQMKESNKQTYTGSRDDLIAQGYDPCKKCNP